MNKQITISQWEGIREVPVVLSKSMAHRLLMAAAFSGDISRVVLPEGEELSQDILATLDCMQAISRWNGDANERVTMRVRESGSTFRFMLPLIGALGIPASFIPEGSLVRRTLSPLYEEMQAKGCTLSPQGTVPFLLDGKLASGTYRIRGDVSSQYITGLLFALPLLEADSDLEIIGTLQSADYVEMTLQVLSMSGILIEKTPQGYHIPGGQRYDLPAGTTVEGDWSNGATWLVLGALQRPGNGIRCTGLKRDTAQGDRRVLDILERFGAEVIWDGDAVTVKNIGPLQATTIDAEQIPDLIPVLSVAAAVAEGTTHVVRAERLRLKESDRLQAITDTLQGLSGKVTLREDGLDIEGVPALLGNRVSSVNDHRIVMMAAIASARCDEPVVIEDAGAIRKSYPDFFARCEALGAKVVEA